MSPARVEPEKFPEELILFSLEVEPGGGGRRGLVGLGKIEH